MQQLESYIKSLAKEGLCVAFSGGVDSSLLLKIACQSGETVHAVTFNTKLHPKADLEVASKIANEVGAVHKVICIDELEIEEIIDNPPERCYHCKRHLFANLIQYAADNNLKYIIDGTNYNDLSEYRPGLKALEELGIISPLAKLQITKEQIRSHAKTLGLSVHNRPSAPCLATRLPYYTKLDMEILNNIDKAEEKLKDYGFATNRVRLHQNIARIEVPKSDLQSLLAQHEKIVIDFKKLGFAYITMDMQGFRSGSMDEVSKY
ncbi:MAG: TIGR00268 family protein [Epulopiscium sp. Nuni2H_MBin001]|nr:MAG: TIGR00268 family protein [Epulopiscium sp. Nuni2H_MBin001]